MKKNNKNKKKKASILSAFRYMGRGRLWLCLSFIALLTAIALSYLPMLISGYAVDSVIGNMESTLPSFLQKPAEAVGGREFFLKNFWVLPVLVAISALCYGVAVFARGKLMTSASEEFARYMRNALYHHLQLLPYDYHKHVSTGDIIQRCTSDIQTVKRFLSNQLIHIVRTFGMLFIAGYIMFSINVPLAIISLSLMPVLVIGGVIYFRFVHKVFTEVDEAEGALSAVLQENVTGVRVVRAFAQQKNEFDKFTAANDKLYHNFDRFYTMMGFYYGISDTLGYIQCLLTIAFGVIFCVNGTLSLGSFLVFSTYSGMLIWPVKQLGRVLADLGKATVSIGRISEIMAEEPEKEPGKAQTPDMRGDIVFSHVSFGYEGDGDVLTDISFTAKQGQTIAILGSTGSGKTSLVHLLQRLYTVTGGEITIGGTNINDIEMHHLRRNIGIVLQEPYLYSRTIMENIRITVPDASDEEVYTAAKAAAIHDSVMDFEKGYDTVVGERGVTLSGGQKQRVAIARMLMQNAPILIFDDSLSAVDTETDMAIRTALKKQRKTATTFIISHRITTLCEADMIIVLEGGRITASGTHNELIKRDGLYRRVAEIQDMAHPVGEVNE